MIPDYRKLYTLLFNTVTDAVEELEDLNIGAAKERLISAQQQAEEFYIDEERDTDA